MERRRDESSWRSCNPPRSPIGCSIEEWIHSQGRAAGCLLELRSQKSFRSFLNNTDVCGVLIWGEVGRKLLLVSLYFLAEFFHVFAKTLFGLASGSDEGDRGGQKKDCYKVYNIIFHVIGGIYILEPAVSYLIASICLIISIGL